MMYERWQVYRRFNESGGRIISLEGFTDGAYETGGLQ